MDKYCDRYRDGASLLMWRDYFPNAQVYGADILDIKVEGERIQTPAGDAVVRRVLVTS